VALAADLPDEDEPGLMPVGFIHDDFVGDAGVHIHLGGHTQLLCLLTQGREQLHAGLLHFVQEIGPLAADRREISSKGKEGNYVVHSAQHKSSANHQ
jgi:hypothetical protein